jgi:hypothetical protein
MRKQGQLQNKKGDSLKSRPIPVKVIN